VTETAKEAEVPVDVREQRSPTKRKDGFEQVQKSHDAPKHSEGHDDAQLVGRHEHNMPRPADGPELVEFLVRR
jgi:hypothetical protein